MNTKPRIAILMATYNGAEFLREQLDSLYSQTNRDWILYVNDDCSNDATVSIIEEYKSKYGNIDLQCNSTSLGAKGNFMNLLERVDSDYYMFCDHDDVWMPHKVERTLEEMKKVESSISDKPAAVFSDLCVVDKNMKVISPSFWDYNRIRPERTSLSWLGVRCVATGCTMMINRKARDLSLRMPDIAKMHDIWVSLVVAKNGGTLCPIFEPLMYYRQHGSNVYGASKESKYSFLAKLRDVKRLWLENVQQYRMLQHVGYGSVAKYVYYKLKFVCEL